MADYEHIIYEKRGHVAGITFNFPEKLNAMDRIMNQELNEIFPEVQRDSSVRVVLLTGAGRGFCSGADVRAFRPDSHLETTAQQPGDQVYLRQPMPSSPMPRYMHDTVKKPVISAINGIAAGAGYGMAMASDIRIASKNASFSHVYLRRALIPSAELWWLQRLVGISNARHLLFTNRDIDAEEAYRIGLVSQLSEPDELMDEAWALAGRGRVRAAGCHAVGEGADGQGAGPRLRRHPVPVGASAGSLPAGRRVRRGRAFVPREAHSGVHRGVTRRPIWRPPDGHQARTSR